MGFPNFDTKKIEWGKELRDIAINLILFAGIWLLVFADLYHYKEDYYKCANDYNRQIIASVNYSINWTNVSSNVRPPLAVISQTFSTIQPTITIR